MQPLLLLTICARSISFAGLVKCDSAVMFGFLLSFFIIFKGVVVITSAYNCSELSMQGNADCGDFVEIKYPFWFDSNENSSFSNYNCGYPNFGIKCVDHGGTRVTVMNISNILYRVITISYDEQRLTAKEMATEGDCPHYSRNLVLDYLSNTVQDYYWHIFYNCSSPPNNKYVQKYHVACLDNSGRRSYVFPDENSIPTGFNWSGNCEVNLRIPNHGFENYTLDAKQGFILSWEVPKGDCENCQSSKGLCSYNKKGGFRKCSCGSDFSQEFDKICPKEKGMGVSPRVPPPTQSVGVPPSTQPVGVSPSYQPVGVVSPSYQPPLKSNHRESGLSTGVKVLIGVFTGVGILLLLVLLIYWKILSTPYRVFNSHWKNKTKGSKNVEAFLESCGHLTVQRYNYSDIKKMTNSFKEILGQGGYGSVFKGKLKHDGRLVAVKLLNESKSDGKDFINEVATIGRTNHVNVVSLLGFCTEGNKRALVYEFMPNGSLEKFIYNEKSSSTPLGFEKLYKIALGIATGLEYLHRGCNIRILHFDIKPHNILLDEEFIPKISDFGLAKLCPTKESVVSMLVARGTIGYIAPEVICRNFGGVSHKSDVYSYGMMVLEIISGRKNIDATVENISEIYFPRWIYNHFKQNMNIIGFSEIFEDETTKKMIIVALWCIQTQPTDRPSIGKVVEMLEGNLEDLQMPPNPFQDPPSRSSP